MNAKLPLTGTLFCYVSHAIRHHPAGIAVIRLCSNRPGACSILAASPNGHLAWPFPYIYTFRSHSPIRYHPLIRYPIRCRLIRCQPIRHPRTHRYS